MYNTSFRVSYMLVTAIFHLWHHSQFCFRLFALFLPKELFCLLPMRILYTFVPWWNRISMCTYLLFRFVIINSVFPMLMSILRFDRRYKKENIFLLQITSTCQEIIHLYIFFGLRAVTVISYMVRYRFNMPISHFYSVLL